MRDHNLGSSTPPTLPGTGVLPPGPDYPNLEVKIHTQNTQSHKLKVKGGERKQFKKRSHFVFPPHPCWTQPAAGRRGPVGAYWDHGHPWSNAGRTGLQVEPPGFSPQTVCSQPPTCKSQSTPPKWGTKPKEQVR